MTSGTRAAGKPEREEACVAACFGEAWLTGRWLAGDTESRPNSASYFTVGFFVLLFSSVKWLCAAPFHSLASLFCTCCLLRSSLT
ncbi:hypothetical protein O3P69_015885 [Scylla paramamosain]|uniref:Uncharacterized protein n=1 Tax=Scylla paramamosain TaxID=85552 RepID=A0AAW0T818_SCYPA